MNPLNQNSTGVFSVTDVVIILLLSFALCSIIGWVYQITHRGASYTQSFVQTLVLNGMIVAIIMLVIGSDIARAFALVGSFSIIRFRNAVKETRDVGFIFLAIAVGMAIGTKFYLLAVITTVFISLIVLIMTRFNWYARRAVSQIPSPSDQRRRVRRALRRAVPQVHQSRRTDQRGFGSQRDADRVDLQRGLEKAKQDRGIPIRDQKTQRQQSSHADRRL